MVKMQCIRTRQNRRDVVLIEFAAKTGCAIGDTWDQESIPVMVGFLDGLSDIQIACRAAGKPYIFIDHANLQEHRKQITYEWFRLCVSHYHLTDWRPSERQHARPGEWQTGGSDVIVLPPTALVQKVYGASGWLKTTLAKLDSHTNRRIVVKEKNNGIPLKSYFADAHAVVSFGSVGEVEALMSGIPVFTAVGPSLPVAETDFTKIETPSYPDRGQWLSAIAGADWHLDEMSKAWERIQPLLGDSECQYPHMPSCKQP